MHTVKKLIALAFLKPNKIVDAFNLIKDDSPSQLAPLISYFDKNYIRGYFGVKLWSCYKLNKKGLPRTSNNAETWHKKINNISGRKKLTTLSLIKLLKDESLDAEDKLDRVAAGYDWPGKKNKKYMQREKRLSELINGPITNIASHLRNIAYNLEF